MPVENTDVYSDSVSASLAAALVEDDYCPRCLGELDTGWECTDCGFDAAPRPTQTTARHRPAEGQ